MDGALALLPAAVAVGAVAWAVIGWPRGRSLLARLAGIAGGTSLAVSAATRLTGATFPEGLSPGGTLALVESAALLVLTTLTVRYEPRGRSTVAALMSGAAVPGWLLRFGEADSLLWMAFAAWSVPSLLAAGVGLYLRSLDALRGRSVASARRAQRLELSRDLHDFVAHDVSEILAQAQAGQIVAERDPATAVRMFEGIERAALRAMDSMDRTVRMLDDGRVRPPVPGLAELPELVERFDASGTATARLVTAPGLTAPREVEATLYRVVVEALTNVRRHAPGASLVEVTVTSGPGRTVRVEVTDDGDAAPAPAGRRGGTGLAGLTERVTALEGTLTAGPREPSGWRTTAELPMGS